MSRPACPRQTTQAYGSFDDWYQKIAGALMWLGEPDPCEGRKALQAEVEDELLTFRQLVLCWHACYHATLSTPRTLKQVAFEISKRGHARPAPAQCSGTICVRPWAPLTRSTTASISIRALPGYALRKYQGRVIDGKRFCIGPPYEGRRALAYRSGLTPKTHKTRKN